MASDNSFYLKLDLRKVPESRDNSSHALLHSHQYLIGRYLVVKLSQIDRDPHPWVESVMLLFNMDSFGFYGATSAEPSVFIPHQRMLEMRPAYHADLQPFVTEVSHADD